MAVDAIKAFGRLRLCDKENCATNFTAFLDIGEEIGRVNSLSISFLIKLNSFLFLAP
jgi:hypothetical protein